MDRPTDRPRDPFLTWRQRIAETHGLPFVVIRRGPVSPPDPDLDLDALLALDPYSDEDPFAEGVASWGRSE